MCWLTSPLVVSLSLPLGVERKALRPPPKSSGFINDGRGYFGGRGIAHLPSSSQSLRELRRRKDWHLSLPPHTASVYFGGGGIGPPPHNVAEYLGGGRTGLPPRTVGVLLVPLTVENDELFYAPPL